MIVLHGTMLTWLINNFYIYNYKGITLAENSRQSQTVDKVGAGDFLQHHFSLKNGFSFNNCQILWIVEVFSSLFASILAGSVN